MFNSERVVLVLGGAGTVGSGIVKGLLDKGKRGHLGATSHERHTFILLIKNNTV